VVINCTKAKSKVFTLEIFCYFINLALAFEAFSHNIFTEEKKTQKHLRSARRNEQENRTVVFSFFFLFNLATEKNTKTITENLFFL